MADVQEVVLSEREKQCMHMSYIHCAPIRCRQIPQSVTSLQFATRIRPPRPQQGGRTDDHVNKGSARSTTLRSFDDIADRDELHLFAADGAIRVFVQPRTAKTCGSLAGTQLAGNVP
ncbi:hypothetical protein IVA79_17530 [Bradyrhizobium sp. 138]|uniref:hypothetical protein n=1 Tax=Bradyrhizobium sp. 138 TaxID=2782615 RepID=UPI001FF7651C|nr:hypothetical protein [Bradyrhizobium sp. 138]MCK1735707.1 hypothetical protein [Bradyrhizobium sp. 138]